MSRCPVLFVSHGAPTLALEAGGAAALLRELGARIPRPRAIVAVSPHWTTHGFAVGAAERPATLHDFCGFPRELHALEYPAAGDAALARQVAQRLAAAGEAPSLDARRGLDHGVWVPLMHLYPDAGIPVVPLSMPLNLGAAGAWRLGETLAPLRAEGVLILASGSLTHNLAELGADTAEAAYVGEFATWVRSALVDRDALLDWQALAPHARRAHPTAEHFLPLLVAAGAAGEGSAVEVLDGGVSYGVLSMDAFLFG